MTTSISSSISSLLTAATTTNAASAGSTSSGSGSSSSSGASSAQAQEQQFLQLMLTEMQNQDPTAPISSSDYASQLAQYTQISNQQATNDTLTSIESLLKGSASNSDLSYLNTDIKVNSPTAPVQDGQASWNYDVTGSPASVTLTVTNASGTVISQTSGDASAGAHDFTLPNQSDGQNLTLTVTAADAKGNALTSNVSSYATVTGVDQSGSAPKLIAGSSEYSSSDVTQVSEASSAATQSAATQNAA